MNSKLAKPCIMSAHLLLTSAKPQKVHPDVGVSETEKNNKETIKRILEKNTEHQAPHPVLIVY